MKLSVVIITHNNFSKKNGCIETVLLSILHQKNIDAEIVVVDNKSNISDQIKLKNLVDRFNKVKLIYNPINNISKGRNLGAENAKSDYIIYMDDDMILNNNLILYDLSKLIGNHVYGYSATRLWTQEGWYESHKEEINKNILKNTDSYDIITEIPDPIVRNKKNNRHLIRTYIGNFGFVRKDALKNVGMWNEDYLGYGVEDDTMAFNLYMKFGRPLILKELSVVHVWHNIKEKNYIELEANKKKFEDILNKNKVKVFHVGRILYEEDDVIEWKEGESNE
jgi:glycosyltransferase involved in cell wall biosynthesis